MRRARPAMRPGAWRDLCIDPALMQVIEAKGDGKWRVRGASVRLLVASVGLAACHSTPLRAPRQGIDDAQWSFSTEHYCPARRTVGQLVDTTPPAPAAIAADPERFAMWHYAAVRRTGTQRYILVQGCQEQARYKCWADHMGEPCTELAPGMSVVNDMPPR